MTLETQKLVCSGLVCAWLLIPWILLLLQQFQWTRAALGTSAVCTVLLVLVQELVSALIGGLPVEVQWPAWDGATGRWPVVWLVDPLTCRMIGVCALVWLLALVRSPDERWSWALPIQGVVQGLFLAGTLWQLMLAWWGLGWIVALISALGCLGQVGSIQVVRRQWVTAACCDMIALPGVLVATSWWGAGPFSEWPGSAGWAQAIERNPAVFSVLMCSVWLMTWVRMGWFPLSGWWRGTFDWPPPTLIRCVLLGSCWPALVWWLRFDAVLQTATGLGQMIVGLGLLVLVTHLVFAAADPQREVRRIAIALVMPLLVLAGLGVVPELQWSSAERLWAIPLLTLLGAALAVWLIERAPVTATVEVVRTDPAVATVFSGSVRPAATSALGRLAGHQFLMEPLGLFVVNWPVRMLATLLSWADGLVVRPALCWLPVSLCRGLAWEVDRCLSAPAHGLSVLGLLGTAVWLLSWLWSAPRGA